MENKIGQLLIGQTNETEDEELTKELELLMATCAPNNNSDIVNAAAIGLPSKDTVENNAVNPLPAPLLPPRVPEEKQHPLSFPDVPHTPVLPLVPTTAPSTATTTTTTTHASSNTDRQPILS